jgi:4-oxalocrotonate tautomerase
MPFVTVKILEGRSPEQKKEIVKGVTKVVADACKTDQNAVHVFFKTGWPQKVNRSMDEF